MSDAVDRARELIDKANECRTEGAIGFLVLAIEALCNELETHQHGYIAPRDANMISHWSRTRSEGEI